MSRWVIPLILTALLLAGCVGDEPFKEAYTARGSEDTTVNDLEKTSTFSTTEENIQLVVTFNQRTKSLLPLSLRWTGPDNSFRDNLDVFVPADTESLVVGLDLAQSGQTYWTPGEWKVEVRLDGKAVDQVAFNVEGEIPEGVEETTDEQTQDGGFDVENPTNPFGSPQATPTFDVEQPANPFGSGN